MVRAALEKKKLGLAFLGSPLVGLFGCVCFGLFLFVCLCLFCFGWLSTMSRWRSFLPDLMTVRAVMVRAAMEKKKELTAFNIHPLSGRLFTHVVLFESVSCS